MEMIEDLNYDCNYNLFLVLYYMKRTLKTESERKRVTEWVTKVMKSNKTLSDLRLRNDFMAYLAMNIQNGELRAPFDQEPQRGPLRGMAKLLVHSVNPAISLKVAFERICIINGFSVRPSPQPLIINMQSQLEAHDLQPGLEEATMREEGDFSLFKFIPAERGGFLIPKPAPQVGAYCYLAAINDTGS